MEKFNKKLAKIAKKARKRMVVRKEIYCRAVQYNRVGGSV